MGARYVVSGVQLGIFRSLVEAGDETQAEKLLNEIVNNQHITNSTEPLDKDIEFIKESIKP